LNPPKAVSLALVELVQFTPTVPAPKALATKTEAIEKANNSEFGLYAAVFTQDLDDRTVRLAIRLLNRFSLSGKKSLQHDPYMVSQAVRSYGLNVD
jgi:hypothetical protein